jgi:hypothetical protein
VGKPAGEILQSLRDPRPAFTSVEGNAMSPVGSRSCERLVVEATFHVQCLARALGIVDGTVSLSFHNGKAQTLHIGVSLEDGEPSEPRECLGLRRVDAGRSQVRPDLPQLKARAKASLHKIAAHSALWLGGERFDMRFSRIEFTIRTGKVHDLVVGRRVLISDLGGVDQLPVAG